MSTPKLAEQFIHLGLWATAVPQPAQISDA